MLSARIGALLKESRRALRLSRSELAKRGGVSTRLVAEFENGLRPNVSLESALKLLSLVGVSVVASSPQGTAVAVRSALASSLERAARAEQRLQTWSGRHVFLHDEGEDPQASASTAKRLATVSQISMQSYRIASATRRPAQQAKRPIR